MSNVYQRLSDARAKFHCLQLKKTGHNKFAGYYYFELGDFLMPALDVFRQTGIISVITFGKELAVMKIINIEKPDDFIEITSPMASAALKGAHEIQNLGAVETYTRRYLWVAALEIVEHDALDSSPKLADKGEIKGTAKKMAAMDGIGDDLPQETKEVLLDLAASATELVGKGKVKEALTMLKEMELEGDQRIFVDRNLHSSIKSALRNFKE